APAQSNESSSLKIAGKVIDMHFIPVAGATVYLEGTFYETETDSSGHFSFQIEAASESEIEQYILIGEKTGYVDLFEEIDLSEETDHTELELVFGFKSYELEEVVVVETQNLTKVKTTSATALSELDVLVTTSDINVITTLNGVGGAQKVEDTGELSVRGGAGTETAYFFDGMILRNQLSASVDNQGSGFRFSPSLFKEMKLSAGCGGYINVESLHRRLKLPVH
ncbi:MAG: carboxypeptidase-like regulatory domain-containing protein, partial [Bacteroidota bacterium]